MLLCSGAMLMPRYMAQFSSPSWRTSGGTSRSLGFRGDVRDYVSGGKGYSLWLANSHDQEYLHAAAMPVECRRVGQAADLGAGHRDWPCARKWTSCPFGNMIIVDISRHSGAVGGREVYPDFARCIPER